MDDILTEADIRLLVNTFYNKVRGDEVLADIFNRVIKDKWEAHLNRMTDFWSTVLLYTRKYKADPLPKHMALPIGPVHFARWLRLFHETIDELFEGEIASNAHKRADNIARIMMAVKNIAPNNTH